MNIKKKHFVTVTILLIALSATVYSKTSCDGLTCADKRSKYGTGCSSLTLVNAKKNEKKNSLIRCNKFYEGSNIFENQSKYYMCKGEYDNGRLGTSCKRGQKIKNNDDCQCS